MCGICGFYKKQNISYRDLSFMNNLMKHRGPDDSGVEITETSDGYKVGLAHRRLSINDLSPMGHQPMSSPNDRLTVAFNGEIYNFLELRKELADYPYKGGSDTEVILAGYLKWGIDVVEYLNGMFAIALYDRDEEKLYLIRDRIGKKPLYYWINNDGIVFASELKPIMACPGFDENIRRDILPRYLYQQYINAPDTIFENVYKLEPGAVLEYDKGGCRTWKYWDIKTVYRKLSSNPVTEYDTAKEKLKDILKKSVSDRLVADVPVGTFLSGGYDSSLVTALAQEQSEAPVKTFSIGFTEKEYDESVYASEVARYLGTDHTNLIIDEQMMLDQVSSIAQYYDEPMADNSQIPSMLVSQLARKEVTVVLTGDGGDEFFCGYNSYDYVRLAQNVDLLGAMLYHTSAVLKHMPSKVQLVALNRDKDTKTQFARQELIDTVCDFINSDDKKEIKYHIERSYNVRSWQIRRMLLDQDTYLPGDILAKVDRATMKYALEARCPILDTRVMEYSYRLPQKFKYFHRDKKHILKDIAYDYIPKELLDRPKQGFGVPIDKWLRGPLKEELMSYSEPAFLKQQDVFDSDYVKKFIDEYLDYSVSETGTEIGKGRITWSFYVFQQWWSYYKEMLKKFKNRGGWRLRYSLKNSYVSYNRRAAA